MPDAFREGLNAYDREAITVDNTVKTLSAAKYRPGSDNLNARAALITVEAQPMRYTLEGTDPVATTTGHYVTAGGEIFLQGYSNIARFKATRDGATSAVIQVTYFR